MARKTPLVCSKFVTDNCDTKLCHTAIHRSESIVSQGKPSRWQPIPALAYRQETRPVVWEVVFADDRQRFSKLLADRCFDREHRCHDRSLDLLSFCRSENLRTIVLKHNLLVNGLNIGGSSSVDASPSQWGRSRSHTTRQNRRIKFLK
jgi:hypothetical protein